MIVHPRIHHGKTLTIKTGTRAGGIYVPNHNACRLAVKTATKVGQITTNHAARRLVVKTAAKVGLLAANHSARRLGLGCLG